MDVDATNEMRRKDFKECTPMYLLNKVSTIVYLMEGLLETIPYEKKSADIIENLFLFCVMWAFGGPMVVDKAGDFRKKFNEALSMQFGQKFPKEKLCFDYVYSIQEESFVDWSTKVPAYQPIPIGGGSGETPFTQLFVPTSDT
eukprot:gene47824-62307_t